MELGTILVSDNLILGLQSTTPVELNGNIGGGAALLSGPVVCGQPLIFAPNLQSVLSVVPSLKPRQNAFTISADGAGGVPYPGMGLNINALTHNITGSTVGNGSLTWNGVKVFNGAETQAGAKAESGAKADSGARAESGAAAQNSVLAVASEITSPTIARIEARLAAVQAIAGKGFDIPHPTKEKHRLRYICLEGPEVGAYIRGTLKDSDMIELPEYWRKLCKPETITVNLTPIGRYQELYVEEIVEWGTKIKVRNAAGSSVHCYYTVFAERVTNDNLQVEYEGLTPYDYPGDNSEYALGGWDYATHKGESKTSDL